MSGTSRQITIDLGAESGRIVVGHVDGERLRLEPVYRFPNRPVRVGPSLFWDVLRLWPEIQEGLTRCAAR